MSHISAQMDTLGEGDVGVCVNGVSLRQSMVQVLFAHSTFGLAATCFHRETAKAGLALCPATPPHLGDGATLCEIRIWEG